MQWQPTQSSGAIARRSLLAVVAAVLALAVGTPARALDHPLSKLYRLDADATHEQGCFGPCLCPLYLSPAIRGTFKLRHLHDATPSSPFDVYRVRNVNWWVTTPDGLKQITGWGRYRVGGEVAVSQRLVLHLRVGDGTAERFDSGFVPVEGGFPRLSLPISNLTDDQQCFGTRIGVSAAPVPAGERQRYRVEGDLTDVCCVCERPFDPTASVDGRFVLVDISTDDAEEYAVTNLVWNVGDVAPLGPDVVRGDGIYRLRPKVSAMAGAPAASSKEQRMTLSLRGRRFDRAAFDSGWVAGGDAFPQTIDTSLSRDGFACMDRVFGIHADLQTR